MLPSARVQMQREGMDPNRVIPVGTHHPQAANDARAIAQLEDLKRSIESRFSSVATPSNFLQAGLYNTLGNNPVTQLIAGAGGAVGDIWDSLMSAPGKADEKAKDPLSALNTHTKLLKDIVWLMDDMADAMKFMAYDGNKKTGFGGGDSGKPGPRSGKHVKQDDGTPMRDTRDQKAPDYRTAEEKASSAKILDDLKAARDDLNKKLETATGEEKAQLEKKLKATNAGIESMERTVAKDKKTPTADANPELEKQLKATTAAIEALERRVAAGSEDAKETLEGLKVTRDELKAKLDANKPSDAKKDPEKFDPDKTINVPAASLQTPPTPSAPASDPNKFDPDRTINTTVDQLERDATREVAEKNKPFDPDARIHTTVDQLGAPQEAPKKKEDKGFFTQLFDRLGFKKASGVIEQFSKTMQKASGELSKTFAQTAKAAKKKGKPLADAIKGSETAKMLGIGKNKLGDIASRVASVASGPVAAMATGMGPKSKIEEAIEEGGVMPDPSALDVALEGGSLASSAVGAWTMLKGGASKAAGWLGKAGSAVKNFAGSNAGKIAGKAAGVLGAGMAGYDAISEEAEGKRIESVGDVVPEGWNKINPFDWVQRGARYAGNKLNKGYEAISGASLGSDVYDLLNSDPMKSEQMRNEKRVSLERPESVSRAEVITKTKQDIEDAKSAPGAKGPETIIGAVNNTTNQNTTVLPTRTVVQNPDTSFNRYVSRSLNY